ncbi:Adenine phosphoribosyltransferase [hydrothermal vent metagenome]|uniref:adenine phosphoribosyltransferase n=1 Tax=hydrothermal vent metagenome TaxID=652676 RepID=A0A1W1EFC7_9ZZZZ
MITLSPEDKKIILDSIRDIQDFPKPGIIFKDITTLLGNHEAFNTLMNHLEKRYKSYDLDYIAGIDARGFIFGAVLADRLNIGFVPVRKKGKLPYTTVKEKYSLEYGFDEVEIHIDAFGNNGLNENGEASKVLLIDDLIATGGTAKAAASLIGKIGANCVEACFVMELSFLNGRKGIEAPVYSVLEID